MSHNDDEFVSWWQEEDLKNANAGGMYRGMAPQSPMSNHSSDDLSTELLDPLQSKCNRYLLVSIAASQTLLTGGLIFGWPLLGALFDAEGVYMELCPKKDKPSAELCAAREEAFMFIYTIATSVFALSVFPTNYLLDSCGPRFSCCVGALLVAAGSILVAISNSAVLDMYVYGFALIAAGGPPIMFSFTHLSNLFPSSQERVLALFNILFDASCVIFLLFAWLHQINTELTIFYLFTGYAILPLIIFISSFYIWPAIPYGAMYEKYDDGLSPVMGANDSPTGSADMSYFGSPDSRGVEGVDRNIEHYSFFAKIKHKTFIFGCCFMVFNVFKCNFYLGTARTQLGVWVDYDADTTDAWLVDLGIVLPLAGMLGTMFVDLFLAHNTMWLSVLICHIMGTIFSIASLFNVQDAEWVIFISLALFKSFLFTTMAGYLTQIFGQESFSKIWALVFGISSLLNLCMIPLTAVALEEFKGSFEMVNAGLLGITVILFAFPVWLYTLSKEGEQSKRSIDFTDEEEHFSLLQQRGTQQDDYSTF